MTVLTRPVTEPAEAAEIAEAVEHPVLGHILNVTSRFVPVTRPDGEVYQHTVIRFGSGYGTVIVPRYRYRGRSFYALIEIDRPAVGTTRLEFPRGGARDLSAAEAARELVEETGLVAPRGPLLLGVIQPDTGTIDSHVGIWLATVEPDQAARVDGFVDPETGSTLRWLDEAQVHGAIMTGRLTCGMSLAAWALHHATKTDR